MQAKSSRLITTMLACATILLGGVVMYGWLAQIPSLIQVLPHLVPMQFNTALCFLLIGLSIFAYSINWRLLAGCCAAIVFVITVMTLCQYIFYINLHIDELFFQPYITTESSHPGRMAPNTAMCFVLLSMAMLLQVMRRQKRFYTIAALGFICMSLILGVMAILGHIINIQSAYGRGLVTQMALHTAIGMIIASLAILLSNSRRYRLVIRQKALVIPVAAFTVGAIISIMLWQLIITYNHNSIKRNLTERTTLLAAKFESEMERRYLAMKRFFSRGASYQTSADWYSDAEAYLKHMPDLVTIIEENPALDHLGKTVFFSPYYQQPPYQELVQRCQTALQTSTQEITFLQQQMPGHKAVEYLCFTDHTSKLAMLVDLNKAIQEGIEKYLNRGTSISIYGEQGNFYQHGKAYVPSFMQQWAVTLPVKVYGEEWHVRTWPDKDNNTILYTNLLPLVFIAFSLTVTLLLSIILYFWQLLRAQNRELVKKVTELNLLYHSISSVSKANNSEEAIRSCLELICKIMGWPLGYLYCLNQEKSHMELTGIVQSPNGMAPQYVAINNAKTYRIGEGLIGRIWQKQNVFWSCKDHDDLQENMINNIADDINTDLHHNPQGCTIAFPVIAYDQAVAVLVCFSSDYVKRDLHFIRMLKLLGRQIGAGLEKKSAEDKLSKLAHYDVTTNLPNRRLLDLTLQKALQHCNKSNEKLALFMVDIDQFKNINDSLGHHTGDKLLKVVAARLSEVSRENDFLSRLSGDEFVIIINNIMNNKEAVSIAKRILAAFSSSLFIDNQEIKISVSIGVATYPFVGETSEDLLRYADTAMYEAKQQGRNTIQLFTKKLLKAQERKALIDREIRYAIEKDELSLVYQPVIDLASQTIVGAEALLRWKHHDLGPISPAEFIAIAESNGTIIEIGKWVLAQACRQMQQWRNNWPSEAFYVSINCSAVQLQSQLMPEQFLQDIKQLLTKHKLTTDNLVVELTETQLMQYDDETRSTLDKLHQAKIRLAIDDFGTGYSSLSYLKSLPISYLKIDQSFVRDIETDQEDRAISEVIVQLAHTLGLCVIAEGLETESQAKIIQKLGGQFGQGYYFSKPLTPQNFIKYLKDTTAYQSR